MRAIFPMYYGINRYQALVSVSLLVVSTFMPSDGLAQSQIDLAVQAANTPVVDVAIVARERMCFAETYGSTAPATKRLHAASISKLFTATLIAKLQEEGKLKLSDPVGIHVEEFKGKPVTLTQLLTHTSGLRDKQHADDRSSPKEANEYIAALAKQQPKPGPWQYTDANFNLLGRVIERVEGVEYTAAMQARLLRPLGMSQSSFNLGEIPVASRGVAYKGQRAQAHPWDLAFAPSSGLQTTAADLAKFVQAVLAVHSGQPSPHLPSRESLVQMTTPHVATDWPGVMQGYGWQIAATNLGVQWRHAGSEDGFESLLTIYPDRGFGIVVMGNREDWPRFELESKLRNLMNDGGIVCTM